MNKFSWTASSLAVLCRRARARTATSGFLGLKDFWETACSAEPQVSGLQQVFLLLCARTISCAVNFRP